MDTPTHDTLRRLHRFHEGVLGIGERVDRTRFVIAAFQGWPVFPAPPGVLEEESVTLHAPEDEPGALLILGRCIEVDPLRDEACDRWLIYHGSARWARWAALEIESVKNVDVVLDGADAQIENPLRRAEAAICKWVNQSPAALAEACRKSVGTAPQSPRLVGVDPYGMDVRAQFGVLRVEFEGLVETEEAVRREIRRMLGL